MISRFFNSLSPHAPIEVCHSLLHFCDTSLNLKKLSNIVYSKCITTKLGYVFIDFERFKIVFKCRYEFFVSAPFVSLVLGSFSSDSKSVFRGIVLVFFLKGYNTYKTQLKSVSIVNKLNKVEN